MSGPKVINIKARRRQLQRECQSGLRELKDAIADWRGCLERAGKLTATAEEQAGTLLGRLSDFPDAQDFGTLRDELHSHTQFFRTEAGRVRSEMVQRTKGLRERRRGVQISAAILVRELRDMGEKPPAEVEWAIEAAGGAGEDQLARLENAVQATFGRLAHARSGSEAVRVTERQRDIAERFKLEGARPLSLSEWVQARSRLGGQTTRDKDDRLTMLLAEVEAWDEGEAIAAFLDRAKVISLEAQPGRRELLTDSLLFDLSEFRNARCRAEELTSRVGKALAMLEPFQSQAANEFRARLEGILASNRANNAEEIAAAAESWCAEEAKREDARLRRDALLKALGELGYEVREGIATAWANAGRVVVRKPGETNYGVELMSAGDTALQTRVVAFERAGRGSEGTPRDKEVEEAWCSDFEQLRSLMSGAGFETVLRQAMPAGAVKIKVVPGDRMEASTSGGHGERGQART